MHDNGRHRVLVLCRIEDAEPSRVERPRRGVEEGVAEAVRLLGRGRGWEVLSQGVARALGQEEDRGDEGEGDDEREQEARGREGAPRPTRLGRGASLRAPGRLLSALRTPLSRR